MTRTWQIVDITPEPAPEERDAIIAALAVLSETKQQQQTRGRSRWREAAKSEAIRGNPINFWRQGVEDHWRLDQGRAT